MQPTDLTIEILTSIRDEVRAVSGRLDSTNEHLERLERRQTESEVRVTTELVAVSAAVREVRDLLREDRALEGRVDDHERGLALIEKRAG